MVLRACVRGWTDRSMSLQDGEATRVTYFPGRGVPKNDQPTEAQHLALLRWHQAAHEEEQRGSEVFDTKTSSSSSSAAAAAPAAEWEPYETARVCAMVATTTTVVSARQGRPRVIRLFVYSSIRSTSDACHMCVTCASRV